MRHFAKTFLLVPVIALAAACGKDQPAADPALNTDLSLVGSPGTELEFAL